MASSKVAINDLDPDHWGAVQSSIQHILSTQVAEYTLAQIVDGLPTKHTDRYRDRPYAPEVDERDNPTATAFNVVAEWRSTFHLEILTIDSDVVQAYQNTSIGTRDFELRLIEITAVAVHTIAMYLFLHTNKPPYKFPKLPNLEHMPTELMVPLQDLPQKPTYLYHHNYIDYEQYPLGIADMVGYWAEYQIFGGVVLFNRGESEKERHTLRIDADDTFALHIFRNKYEREPPVVVPWLTSHPRRMLEDDPNATDMKKFLDEKYGDPDP
ncbi:uncharacterized protein N7459_008563 [Penicillium hispanicum]|uniref:uncharacterized protein n=1 Tax=Penicillium hispanicum TaxID=1080232 RepID=UPI0025402B10|nr:uncharacterized protein N7459_008563 [Penicillium hispanicum]KAJ5574136.1 hypothetical protein N7459_008563 [Penicillium hispanicum]